MKIGPHPVRLRWLKRLAITAGAVIAVMVLSPPVIKRSDRNWNLAHAISNLRQIGLELQLFDTVYDSFPSDSTAAKVRAETKTELSLTGASSNALFRQLIANGLKSEKLFYCPERSSRKPDDQFSDDAYVLAPGECGFAYVAGLSSAMDPETPVVMAPMVPGTQRFDAFIFDGKAVILFLDNSAKAVDIDSAGQVILNGINLFDPRQPFWHGKVPDLRLPD